MIRTKARSGLLACGLLLLAAALQAREVPGTPTRDRWTLLFGFGHMHTMGEIRTVWHDRIGEIELSIGYFPWGGLGVELTGLLGFNSMTETMKNSISVYFPGSGKYGNQTSWGGVYQGLLLGPKVRFPVSPSGWTAEIGCGVGYAGDREVGINAEGYTPRWTYGWGAYGVLGISHRKRTWRYGLQARYVHSRAKVNDFYYDRIYGKSSYDEIPPTYVNDARLMIVLVLGL